MKAFKVILLPIIFGFLSCNQHKNQESVAESVNQDTLVQIAKEAYIYGYPMVDNYKVMSAYSIFPGNPEYKKPFNELSMDARVFTPDDKIVQTPNSDTPYGMVSFDLRAQPYVLTVPPIEANRYFSVQFIDMYTHNFDYLGTRTSGNKGGKFLIAGPDWKGEKPTGIDRVIQSETQFAFAIFRTQLFNPGDVVNVKKIQEGYTLQPLNEYLKTDAKNTVSKIDFPVYNAEKANSPEFFNYLNFILQFCPTHSSEVELRKRFAKIGVEPGKTFSPDSLQTEAIKKGIEEGKAEMDSAIKIGGPSASKFGNREFLKNNYLARAVAAKNGIYGNSREEAMYPFYKTDSEGEALDGSKHQYELKFEKDKFPPVNAFWSVTMYRLPEQLLVSNPINRYLINSPMLPQLKRDHDGGITIYIQKNSPGKDKESNWLPAPDGPFFSVLRLYYPKEVAMNGTWNSPPMKKIK